VFINTVHYFEVLATPYTVLLIVHEQLTVAMDVPLSLPILSSPARSSDSSLSTDEGIKRERARGYAKKTYEKKKVGRAIVELLFMGFIASCSYSRDCADSDRDAAGRAEWPGGTLQIVA
jgi:hypothetical protein